MDTVGGTPVTSALSGTVAQVVAPADTSVRAGAVLVLTTNAALNGTVDSDRLALVDAQQAQPQYSPCRLAAQLSQDQAAETSAANHVKQLQAAAEALVVRATTSGVVTAVPVSAGTNVSTGTTLATVESRQLNVRFRVSQAQRRLMRVGQSAQVTATPISAVGRISSIGYAASYSGGLATFPVVVSLPAVSGLRPGMAVQATINVKQVTRGYVVPLEALHQQGPHATIWVRTQRDTWRLVSMCW